MSVIPSPTQQTRGKNHESSSIRYNTLGLVYFDNVSLLNSASTLGSLQAFLPLPITCKILGVELVAIGQTNAVRTFNICMGTLGAYAGIPTADNTEAGVAPPTPATFGNCVFNTAGGTTAADQVITLVNGIPQFVGVPPPYFDAVWPQNGLMTLRISTAAAGGTLANTVSAGAILKVGLLVVPYDPVPWRPSTTGTGTSPAFTFNPVNDLK